MQNIRRGVLFSRETIATLLIKNPSRGTEKLRKDQPGCECEAEQTHEHFEARKNIRIKPNGNHLAIPQSANRLHTQEEKVFKRGGLALSILWGGIQ